MKLAQSIVYKTGEKIKPSFAGIQSLCGDAFANPYLADGINFTLGCDGSRKAADIKDNENSEEKEETKPKKRSKKEKSEE